MEVLSVTLRRRSLLEMAQKQVLFLAKVDQCALSSSCKFRAKTIKLLVKVSSSEVEVIQWNPCRVAGGCLRSSSIMFIEMQGKMGHA
ncbi:hypothetical protein GOP47_0016285 [Adiantum capillus-veneris]|uniref:Uncharacterized protein n=1 Tax=Adiantum capillus-veneris TaxID=13818 RepID=A0A9D4UHE2_ADICA|nr:hypothetical protein GOP47_0016285 [Adiantum capillus-veneris]